MNLKMTIALLFMAASSFAQFTETAAYNPDVQIREIGSFRNYLCGAAKLSTVRDHEKVSYMLEYHSDMNAKERNAIHFDGTAETLDALYDLLNSFFLDENKNNENYTRTFRLGETAVICTYFSNWIEFKTEDGHVLIPERQLNKLFGRKRK